MGHKKQPYTTRTSPVESLNGIQQVVTMDRRRRKRAGPPPPLRAFSIQERYERTGDIYFARHAITALKRAADDFGHGMIAGLRCLRAPWADRFATKGRVPISAAVSHGWHFECDHCGRRIDDGGYDDDSRGPKGVVGYMDGICFCSGRCRTRHNKERRLIADERARLLPIYKEALLRRFPFALPVEGDEEHHSFIQVEGGVPVVRQVAIRFRFEGQRYQPANYRHDNPYDLIGPTQPELRICNGDVASWNALVGYEAFEAAPLCA